MINEHPAPVPHLNGPPAPPDHGRSQSRPAVSPAVSGSERQGTLYAGRGGHKIEYNVDPSAAQHKVQRTVSRLLCAQRRAKIQGEGHTSVHCVEAPGGPRILCFTAAAKGARLARRASSPQHPPPSLDMPSPESIQFESKEVPVWTYVQLEKLSKMNLKQRAH